MNEIAAYSYPDETRAVLYEIVRFDPKDFRPRRYGADGEVIWNLEGVRRVPYRLPEVLAAKARDDVIIVVEGEKDADNLRKLGYTATTNAGGASWPWTPDFIELFRGVRVVVIADNDDAGRTAAQNNVEALLVVAQDVWFIEHLPDVPEKGDVSDLIAAGWTKEQFDALIAQAPRIGPEGGAAILNDIICFIQRYVVVNTNALLVLGLWVMHTHALDAATCTPYLSIGSPQKRCGKSLLLELLELLVARPFPTSRTSVPALIRKIAKDKCTLLLDEIDAAFKGNKDYMEALRGILNAGYRRGAVATLCVGKDHHVEDFDVFSAKAFGGIGKSLPDTVMDRAISIPLQRKTRNERVERFRRRKVTAQSEDLRLRIERWTNANVSVLRDYEPALPDELTDRAQDSWEPLLAIADFCDAGAPARQAAIVLAASRPEDDDLGLRTLADVRTVFRARHVDRLETSTIIADLRKMDEGPYGDFNGNPFSARTLAKRLEPFGIPPPGARRTIRFAGHTFKGYHRSWFEDTWLRYLPRESATEVTKVTDEPEIPGGVTDVTDVTPLGDDGAFEPLELFEA